MKETQDLNNGKISYVHGPTDNLSKVAILLKLIYKCNASPGNIQGGFLQNWQSYHKIHRKCKGSRLAKQFWRRTQHMVLGQLHIHMPKNEIEPWPHTTHEKLIQMSS